MRTNIEYLSEDGWKHSCFVEVLPGRFVCNEAQIHAEVADAIIADPSGGMLAVHGVQYRWSTPRTIDSDWRW